MTRPGHITGDELRRIAIGAPSGRPAPDVVTAAVPEPGRVRAIFTFDVPCAPVAKGRPRGTAVGGHVRFYTPTKTRTFEECVAAVAARHVERIERPCRMFMTFVLPRPKSLTAKRDGAGRVRCSKRPDLDNYVKALLDGLCDVLADDALVYGLTATKMYAAVDEAPHVEVRIEVDA